MKKVLTIIVLLLGMCLQAQNNVSRWIDATDDMKREYIGKTYAEIVHELGAPTSVVSDGQGGQILTYKIERYQTTREVKARAFSWNLVAAPFAARAYTTSVGVADLFGFFHSQTVDNSTVTDFFVDNSQKCYNLRTNAKYLYVRYAITLELAESLSRDSAFYDPRYDLDNNQKLDYNDILLLNSLALQYDYNKDGQLYGLEEVDLLTYLINNTPKKARKSKK